VSGGTRTWLALEFLGSRPDGGLHEIHTAPKVYHVFLETGLHHSSFIVHTFNKSDTLHVGVL